MMFIIYKIIINAFYGFSDKNLTGLLFPKEFIREKSDSQMQGDQYVTNSLDIDATIRAYQVPIPPRDFCTLLHPRRISTFIFFYSFKRHVAI